MSLKCQIAALIKVSILDAANREAVRPDAAEHTGIATGEVQAARGSANCGTRPVVADGTNNAERTIAVEAVACYGQFKRGGKSPHRCICIPT